MRSRCTSGSRGGWFGACLALLGAAACASGAAFDGSLYRGASVSFRVAPLPSTWSRVSLPAADLAFRDATHDGSILINSRCASADRDAPLLSLTQHLLIGTTDRQISHEENVPFDSREARHTVLRARLDGVSMAYDIFVLKKDGCVYDLVYVAPPTASGSGAAEFEQFVQGFHTVPSSG